MAENTMLQRLFGLGAPERLREMQRFCNRYGSFYTGRLTDGIEPPRILEGAISDTIARPESC